MLRADSFFAVDLNVLQLFLTVFKGLSQFKLLFDSVRLLEVRKHVMKYWFPEFILSDLLLSEHLVEFVLHFVGYSLSFYKLKVFLWT